MRERASVSLCMIVKDEEHCICRVLTSVLDNLKSLREIILVDTGSSDKTIEKAQECLSLANRDDVTLKSHLKPFRNDFALSRNESFRLATSDWVIWLDADDEASIEFCQQIDDSINNALPYVRENAAFTCGIFPYYYLLDSNDNPVVVVPRERLLKRESLQFPVWRGKVHECIDINIYKTKEFTGPILHRRTFKDMEKDANRNLKIMGDMIQGGSIEIEGYRFWMYYGFELFHSGQKKLAISALKESLRRNPSNQEIAIICEMICQCL